ncbi:MAG: hypothetical protein ABSE73_27400 [Planctomycetota bacterium]
MKNYTLQFWLLAVAGWINREQQDVIAYLQEENRVYREMLGDRRLRFNDQQRRRLATKAKALAHRTLAALDSIVTPDTLLRWYLELIARKYDGSRRWGQPRTRTTLSGTRNLAGKDPGLFQESARAARMQALLGLTPGSRQRKSGLRGL